MLGPSSMKWLLSVDSDDGQGESWLQNSDAGFSAGEGELVRPKCLLEG